MAQTGIVKTFRSQTSGNVPPTGTRQVGELWVNMADNQLGYVDATATAQKLLGVRNYSNLANYLQGDFVVYQGQLYRAIANTTAGAFNAANWSPVGGSVAVSDTPPASPQSGALWFDSAGAQLYAFYNGQWVIAVNQGGAYLPTTGGTLTGPLYGVDPPAGDNSEAIPTTAWVNANRPQNRNRIINGDMRIDQRNNGAAGYMVDYTVDRWRYVASQTGKGGYQRLATGSGLINFAYSLSFTSSSAYVSLASDFFQFQQPIEADMVGDFAWGTPQAQPVTLSFWAISNLTGMFGGSIKNAAGNRSYPFSFSLPIAMTWTRIIIVIPADTTGTWVMSGSGVAVYVLFDLGTGSTYRGPAGAWASTTYNGVTGAISVVGTNGGTFSVTGVQLEVGTQATPFDWRPIGEELALCQRYYQILGGAAGVSLILQGYSAGANLAMGSTISYNVAMRAIPTAAYFGDWYNLNFSTGTMYPGIFSLGLSMLASGVGQSAWYPNGNAGITLNAEL